MPERIQLSRRKGWRKPENTVVVARPSKWGNPFSISSTKESRKAPRWWHVSGPRDSWSYLPGQHAARAKAVEEFRRWLLADLSPYDWHWAVIQKQQWMRAALESGELAGKNLACWCPPDQPCHADILLALANPTKTPGPPRMNGSTAIASGNVPGPTSAPTTEETR